MEIWNWLKDLWNSIRNWKETLSFKIHEDDAREIYPELCKEINNAVPSITSPFLSTFNTTQNKFTELEKHHKHSLISKTLWDEIQEFLKKIETLRDIKNEVFREIREILSEEKYKNLCMKLGDPTIKKDITFISPIIYKMLIAKDYSMEHFKKEAIKCVNHEEITNLEKDVKENKKIREFLNNLEKFESFSEELKIKIMIEYKENLQKPEFTRNILTLLVLTMAIIGGCIAWEEKQDNKELMKGNNLLIERQLEAIAPLNPQIKFFIPQHMLSFNKEYLIKDPRVHYLYLLISNIGQFPAGYVNIRLVNEEIHCYVNGTKIGDDVNKGVRRIEYLNKTDIAGVQIYCYLLRCGGEDCNSSVIDVGEQELNLTIECEYCNNTVKDTVKICVYEKDAQSDCGEEWTFS